MPHWVSVPLRGLDMWKQILVLMDQWQLKCFSPLAGIRYVETKRLSIVKRCYICSFSPLAGIRYVETLGIQGADILVVSVSVPLRGLDMWKLMLNGDLDNLNLSRFSPLAGIRYVETSFGHSRSGFTESFSPLAGIRYVETLCEVHCINSVFIMFQSPCGD